MTQLWQLGAAAIVDGVRSRAFSCAEVVASVVARIEQRNPDLNAITVNLCEQALADAANADRGLAAGRAPGSLEGVPVTIKENVDMAGHANTNGDAAYTTMMASEDAPLVRNLKRAGAIVVGRTNTPEFSMRATTDNPLRGRTVNPWHEDASPGGSSGGAGVAAAAGMGPVHHGNDIGGSLRFPAFANGAVTVKPTSFRVPVFNSSAPVERGPLSQAMSVQGVIAREAADVALAMQSMIAPDARDPNCPPVPWQGPSIAAPVPVALSTASHGYPAHEGIIALVERAGEQLADAGYKVERVDPPPVAEPAGEWFKTGSTDLLATLDSAIQTHGSDTIKQIFQWFYARSELLDRDGYIRHFAYRTRLMRRWDEFLAQYPLLVCPFMMRPLYHWNYDASGEEAFNDLFDASIWSTGINYLGLPAGVIGMDRVDGLPAAVQIVARRYREDLICEAMSAVESRNGVMVHRLWDERG